MGGKKTNYLQVKSKKLTFVLIAIACKSQMYTRRIGCIETKITTSYIATIVIIRPVIFVFFFTFEIKTQKMKQNQHQHGREKFY